MSRTRWDRRIETLQPYVPRLVIEWLRAEPETTWREVEGSLAFVDISGFTSLTERLARKGKVGAEEMNDLLNACFAQLLAEAYDFGAELLKWGGDAVLLLFRGPDHAGRACRAAHGMRRLMRTVGRIQTSSGRVTLRMSVGIHSGTFQFFLVGDPGLHRELVVAGPGASTTARMESIADAGQIALSPSTAAALDPRYVGERKGEAYLLKAPPDLPVFERQVVPDLTGLDIGVALPVLIREQLLAQAGHPVEPEHRPIAVAFVQFSGTDGLIEEEGAAAAAVALDEFVRVVQGAVHRHRVTFMESDIDQNGGKVLLVAGTPRSLGDEEGRMLRAARAMIDIPGRLPIRIGVNRGHVFVSDFGPSFRRTFHVTGDAVNLAARVMGKAAPGQVLANEAVVSETTAAFELEPLEPFRVKGKTHPVHAYSIGSLVGTRVASWGPPLVGRERELAVLQGALDRVRVGRSGAVVELVGEPGLGKSRLVDEIRTRGPDVIHVTAVCNEYDSATPYRPFRELLRDLLGFSSGAPPDAIADRLRNRVEANAPELVPWLPLLAAPLDVDLAATTETDELEERFRKARVEDVTRQFLSWALPTPTLLMFDDVHWMDESSVGLLQHLADGIEERPWLILTTRRALGGGFAPSQGPVTSLHLEPLPPDAVAALLTTATEDAPLPPHELAALADRSGGNPLFLTELVRASQQSGGVEGLPGSIEGVVTAQMDHLSPQDRTVLRYASVLGVSFTAELLRAMLEGDVALPSRATWQRLADFIERDGPTGFRFRHALIRDAAYDGLSFGRRRSLHGRVGDVLEVLPGENPEERAELLSLHFFAAQRFSEAWRYSLVAGDRARTIYANVEAAAFYERALEAGRRLRDVPSDEVARVTASLGDVKDLLGLNQEAVAAFRAARRICRDDPAAVAELWLKESWIAEREGRYPYALRLVRFGERAVEGADGGRAARLRAQLQVWHAVVRYGQGRFADAIECSWRAIRSAEVAHDQDALAHAYYILDMASVEGGVETTARYSPLALEIYEELGDLAGQAVVSNNLGGFAYFEGRWDDALDLYRRGREARERTGDPVNAADGTNNIGEILSDQGRIDEAEPMFKEALRIWRAAGYRRRVALATSFLGRAAYRSGRFDEAESLLEQAVALYREIGSEGGVLETESYVAELHAFRSRSTEALEATARLLAQAGTTAGPTLVAMLLRTRGYALIQTGALPDARKALEASIVAARSANAAYEIGRSQEAMVRLCAMEGVDPPSDVQTEYEAIFGRLGIISTPVVPLPARMPVSA
jgi:class 3 adenylate cyclase/tetratricopeptide (TPR) repeat protein